MSRKIKRRGSAFLFYSAKILRERGEKMFILWYRLKGSQIICMMEFESEECLHKFIKIYDAEAVKILEVEN